MAQFNFNLNDITGELDAIYPSNVSDSDNVVLINYSIFKNYDTYLQTISQGGILRFKLDVPNATNDYLFLCSLWKSCRVVIFMNDLLALDSIPLAFHQVEVTNLNAGTYTDMGVQCTTTVIPAPAITENYIVLLPIDINGLLMRVTAGTLTGSLTVYFIFTQVYDGESTGNVAP